MAKQTGLGDHLIVDGYNISGDIGSLSRIGGGPAALDVTGIDKSAFERRGGKRDGGIEFSSWFNPDTDQEHPVLSALPRADRVVTYFRGLGAGSAAASVVGKQIGYDANRGDDASLTLATAAQANGYGLEWGVQLTDGIEALTGAGNLAGVDFGAASAFGLQACLHVLAFTGTSATVALQSSSDDGSTDAYAAVTGGAFAAATGVGSQRIETARDAAIERWLRVAVTGVFSELSFIVAVTRNDTEVQF